MYLGSYELLPTIEYTNVSISSVVADHNDTSTNSLHIKGDVMNKPIRRKTNLMKFGNLALDEEISPIKKNKVGKKEKL